MPRATSARFSRTNKDRYLLRASSAPPRTIASVGAFGFGAFTVCPPVSFGYGHTLHDSLQRPMLESVPWRAGTGVESQPKRTVVRGPDTPLSVAEQSNWEKQNQMVPRAFMKAGLLSHSPCSAQSRHAASMSMHSAPRSMIGACGQRRLQLAAARSTEGT